MISLVVCFSISNAVVPGDSTGNSVMNVVPLPDSNIWNPSFTLPIFVTEMFPIVPIVFNGTSTVPKSEGVLVQVELRPVSKIHDFVQQHLQLSVGVN